MSTHHSERTWDGHVANAAELGRELHALQPSGPSGEPLAMAAVLNLVVVIGTGDAGGAEAVIASLADHQPSRAIVIERDADGDGIDAHIEARAQLMGSTRTPSRVELLHLRLHGTAAEGAASAVRALLRPDLPMFVWWPGIPAADDRILTDLAWRADRLILETDQSDGAAALAALARLATDHGPAVTDLAWAALTPWRQLLNQLTTRDHLEEMRAGATITIRDSAAAPGLGALLLAGWLRDSIGASAEIRFASAPRPGGPAVCGIHLASASGRVVAIDRVAGRPAVAVLTHAADGTSHDRMMPLPELTRAQLLAGELELQRRDRPFERSLRHAVELVRPGR